MKRRRKTGLRLDTWHAWCAGCGPHTIAGFTTCKDGRLCDRIDLRLPSLLGTNDLARCEAAQRDITLGGATASTYVERNDWPATAEAFVTALCTLHGMIFARGAPAIAGRFRHDDDPEVRVGGDGDHAFVAMPCGGIRAAMHELYACIPTHLVTLPKLDVLRTCARFLESFFRAHPFVDGNGRVGRLVVTWLCRTRTRYRFELFDTRGRRRRRYLRALQYAHKHVAASTHPDRRANVSPLRPLMAWLALYLVDGSDAALLEAGPPDDTPPPD